MAPARGMHEVAASFVESLPPELLDILPAQSPPPGATPNFDNPASLAPVIMGVGTAFLAFATFCFAIRMYTNIRITRKWNWGDLTLTIGFMFSIAYYAFIILGSVKGSAGRHLWELRISQALNKPTLLQSYASTILITPALGLIKTSLFIQYYLIFNPVQYIRVSAYIGGALSTLFYAAVTISAFALTSPWPGETLIQAILSWHYVRFQQFSIPTGVIGMVLDWWLFFLPMPAVLGLRLSRGKKAGVLLVFMTGGLAAVASTVTLYYRVKLQRDPTDEMWKVADIYVWAQIELFAGVAAASMPAVKRFFKAREGPGWGSSMKQSFRNVVSWRGGSAGVVVDKEGDLESSRDSYPLRGVGLDTDGRSVESKEGVNRLGSMRVEIRRDIVVTDDSRDLTLSRW